MRGHNDVHNSFNHAPCSAVELGVNGTQLWCPLCSYRYEVTRKVLSCASYLRWRSLLHHAAISSIAGAVQHLMLSAPFARLALPCSHRCKGSNACGSGRKP